MNLIKSSNSIIIVKPLILLGLIFLFIQDIKAQKTEIPKGLEPFAFTLGKWEFEWHHLDPATRKVVDDGKAYSSVTLIHNGQTYADEFYKKNADGSEVIGTTFRGYDPVTKKLKMCWLVAGNLNATFMEGQKVGDEVVLFVTEKQSDKYGKYRVRITFYDITPTSYKWKNDYIYDDGTIIEKTSFYEATRVYR